LLADDEDEKAAEEGSAYLAVLLCQRFELTGELPHPETTARLSKRVEMGFEDGDPIFLVALMSLGAIKFVSCLVCGDTAGLDEVIQSLVRAARSASSESASHYHVKVALGNALYIKSQHSGDIEDLGEAIRLFETPSTPPPGKSELLRDLLLVLVWMRMFDLTQQPEHLDKAIKILRKLHNHLPEDSPVKDVSDQLGEALFLRGIETGSSLDISEGLRHFREVVDPSDATTKTCRKIGRLCAQLFGSTNLFFHIQLSRTGSILDSRIFRKFHPLFKLPTEDTQGSEPGALGPLGITHDVSAMQKIAQEICSTLDTMPRGHLEWLQMSAFVAPFLKRLSYIEVISGVAAQGSKNYLHKAMDLLRQALEAGRQTVQREQLSPQSRIFLSALSSVQYSFLDLQQHRFTMSPLGHADPLSSEEIEEAIEQCTVLLEDNSIIWQERIAVGAFCVQLCARLRWWDKAYDAASKVADLITPKLSHMRSPRNTDNISLGMRLAGFASEAAGVALRWSKRPADALRLFEQGRAIIATAAEQSRVDLKSLQATDPDLADRFIRLREELSKLEVQLQNRASEEDSDDVWKVKAEFDDVLTRIKELPRPYAFSPSFQEDEDVPMATSQGPVVVINVSESGCDAILIETQRIRVVPLKELSVNAIKSRAAEGKTCSYETLEWLWNVVAQPVLDALGFDQAFPASSSNVDGISSMPHVWWIPTGPLVSFPLHAAGLHRDFTGRTVLDRVVSSYSSSVKLLAQARRRVLQIPSKSSTGAKPNITETQALLVSMKHTPGVDENATLAHAEKEVEEVAKLCASLGLQPTVSDGNKQDVVRNLQSCHIFHFAGHGITDHLFAFNSRILLRSAEDANNPQDRALTVEELMDMDLAYRPEGRPPPFLAYLSACGTSRLNGSAVGFDESMHLAGAFQIAGFRHAVGTLWNVLDSMCVDVARMTYEGILQDYQKNGTWTDEGVARALHAAQRRIRDEAVEVMGATRVARDLVPVEDDNQGGDRETTDKNHGNKMAMWAPYVHYGP
jgi:tetratricopeptide (TPR) repeat protein